MLHRNFGLKATAFFLAVVLWVWVIVNERNPVVTRTFDVPVRLTDCAPNLTLQYPPEPVQVTVRGLKQDLVSIPSRVQAVASAQGCSAGNYPLKVSVTVPEDVTVVGVQPDVVVVNLERTVSKVYKVETKLVGDLPPGHQYLGVDVTPSTLRVTGPLSKVQDVFRVIATLDLQRVVPDIPVTVPAMPVDASGARVEGVTPAPQQVTLNVKTKRDAVSRTLPVVLQVTGTLPEGIQIASIQVTPPMVTIVGSEAEVKAIDFIHTVNLPLENITTNATRKLALIAPEGVNLLMTNSVTATLKVTRLSPSPTER